jgi:signal recognition particle subunit SEC65
MKEKSTDDCEYYQIGYDKNKKPEKVRKKPKKTTEKKLSINEIVSKCRTLGISYGQFQALRKEQEKAE